MGRGGLGWLQTSPLPIDNKGDSLPTHGLHAPRLGNSGLHWGRGGLVMLVDGSDMSDKNTYLPYLT